MIGNTDETPLYFNVGPNRILAWPYREEKHRRTDIASYIFSSIIYGTDDWVREKAPDCDTVCS